MGMKKTALTKGDITVSKFSYPGATTISIRDTQTETEMVVFTHEAQFLVQALTELLSQESSNPPSDQL